MGELFSVSYSQNSSRGDYIEYRDYIGDDFRGYSNKRGTRSLDNISCGVLKGTTQGFSGARS